MTQDRIKFSQSIGFKKELSRRVDAYFQLNNVSTRDNPQMYLKTAFILGWVFSAWGLTLFVLPTAVLKLLGCVVLAFGLAAYSFNIGHDANHGGYSNNPTVNHLLGLTYDLIGTSSYLWRFRHNFLHHTYTNILGHDVEIHGDGLVRMSPAQNAAFFHRFQHIYIWFVYCVIPFYWSWCDVQIILFKPYYHTHAVPTPKPSELITLLGFKLFWLGYVLGIPLAVGYSIWQVLIGVCLTYMTYGFVICVVFMMAHVMEKADFAILDHDNDSIDDEWAVWQVRTTVDFATKNQFLNWYLGGLNHQVTHHLFPQICHVHYPKISQIVQQVCQEFGIKYRSCPTLKEAIFFNYQWLKTMSTSTLQPVSNPGS